MKDAFVNEHQAKHLLTHVLVAAGVQRWPGVRLGRSGETSTGFFADFALPAEPDEAQLSELTDDMARLLREVRTFREIRLPVAAALDKFRGHPWKRFQIEALAESESEIRCLELEGTVDICDCALKSPRDLQVLHPEKFLLTRAHPMVWSHRGRDEFFVRIHGELFPTPTPCGCCQP